MTTSHEVTLTIQNELGLHARAATQFVQTATQFEADVVVSKDFHQVNGKSILGILTLIAVKGSQITVYAEGPDAKEVCAALALLVDNKFGEDV